MVAPRTLTAIATDLRDVVRHFELLGLPIGRGRIRSYLELLDAAVRGDPVDRGLIWAAACEVEDLVSVASLDPASLGPVRHRIADLCAGDLVFTSQSKHDPGRNLCFELVTAAMLQRVGGQSKLGSPSDVVNMVGGQALLVECKRPTTFAALGRRLKDGYRQMSEHRRAGHVGVGAIAVEVSVLVNPGFDVLVAESQSRAIDGLYGHIQRVFQVARIHLADAARNARRDAGVHLLMFRAKCMAGDGAATPYIASVWHLEPVVSLASPEFSQLYYLMKNHSEFNPGIWVGLAQTR